MAHDGYPHEHNYPHLGHNGHSSASQWQTPHLSDHHHHHEQNSDGEPDLDLVEAAFVDAFPKAEDPTSFLRLAGIPFTGTDSSGTLLHLLRVETGQTTDMGSLTPHLGGLSFRYDPLPAKMTSRRNSLVFVYTDGASLAELTLNQAKALNETGTAIR